MRRPLAWPVDSPPDFCPTCLDSSVPSHFSSSPAVMLTVERNSFHVSSSVAIVGLAWTEGGQFLSGRKASGLCTASAPVLLLLTRYCGSCLDARTVRPAALVSSVIFSSTVPFTFWPWLFHCTLSPLLNFLSAMPIPFRVPIICLFGALTATRTFGRPTRCRFRLRC